MTYFEKLILLAQRQADYAFEARRIARKYARFEARCRERVQERALREARYAKAFQQQAQFHQSYAD